MSKIKSVRSVLLSAPYADEKSNAEVQIHLTSGYRTCGMVEITLENGIKGLGEGYLAVFAPHVFRETVDLLAPYIIGQDIEKIDTLVNNLIVATGYWSLQGAARHVVSAFEIAMTDCLSQQKGIPVYEYLGGKNKPLQMYGSGGDSLLPEYMEEELKALEALGIKSFKIRARPESIAKALWTVERARSFDVSIAIDLTQNLASPGLSVPEVLEFEENLVIETGIIPVFLEEALGMDYLRDLPELTKHAKSKIAGGEIVTTEKELIDRINTQSYHIAQPDATVIGGIGSVMKVFEAARKRNVQTVVHCWGGAVCMMANYHAAIAGDASLVEYPMPQYPLREAMLVKPWEIKDGLLNLHEISGLGVKLTPEIEKEFAFREEAVYNCLPANRLKYSPDLWK